MHVTQLKQKIKSITMTRKVTDALRLISMSLYGNLERHKNAIQMHTKAIQTLLHTITAVTSERHNPLFWPVDHQDTRPLFIIIGPLKGFCGSLQEHFLRYLEQYLTISPHQNPTFIVFGKTTRDFVKNRYPHASFTMQSDLNIHNYANIAQQLLQDILGSQKPFSSVTCYGHQFKSFFLYKQKKIALIPVAPEHNDLQQSHRVKEYIWEQSPEIILNHLIASYLQNILTKVLFESVLCEYAARFIAMDGATTNADNVLEKMQLQYNKLRQALITKELVELLAGTENQDHDD